VEMAVLYNLQTLGAFSSMKNLTFLLAVACLSFTLPAFCQTETATISGRVTDSSGAAISGADVQVQNVLTGRELAVKTNSSGVYVATALQPGTYRVIVSNPGFKQIVKPDVILNVQDNASINFGMQIGSASETVTVGGGAPLVDTETGSVSTVVDREFVQDIPLNGRSFQDLIQLTPGVTAVPGAMPGAQGEFSVNGQRTEANYYMVDGVSATTGVNGGAGVGYANGSTPMETQLGTTQSLVSVDALQEFRISSSTYSAEFGRTPGAQISLVTRSGTNAWHGTAFDYFRNDALDANNWFNDYYGTPRTEERQNDFGGTLGGPVRIPGLYNGKDKTFFFFSYEGLRLVVPTPAQVTFVPDTSLRQNAPAALQPLLNAFPKQNGPELADNIAEFTSGYSAPSSLDAYSIRLDQFIGKVNLFARFSDSPSQSQSRTAADLAAISTNNSGARALTLGMTAVLTPKLTNELHFNLSWTNNGTQSSTDDIGGAVPVALNQLFPTTPPASYQFGAYLLWDQMPGLSAATFSIKQQQMNITDASSVALGRHVLKFGVDFRRLSAYQYANQLENIYVFFAPSDILNNNVPFALTASYGTQPPDAIFWNYSAYVQDQWKVSDRLNLSYGLRWDVNPAPTNGNGPQPYTLNQISNLATSQLAPEGTRLYATDYHGFGPRLGAAYQLRRRPDYETVLRGGFGIFYDTGNALASEGLSGGVGFGSNSVLGGIPFPTLPSPPSPSTSSPYNGTVTAFDPHLRLPYTREWNLTVEQAFGRAQKLTVSYVGAQGRRLTYLTFYDPGNNLNFALGNGLNAITNGSTSDYDALQVEFQRRLAHGLQVLASYTWAHSIDDRSFNGNAEEDPLVRGNSDFDVRHTFTAGLIYQLPSHYSNPVGNALLAHWSADVRILGRSALPFDVNSGVTVLPNGSEQYLRPDLVPGVPIYINDPTAPGGRYVNANAFVNDPNGLEGDAPRNFLRGFDFWQTNLALQREFPLLERLKLQFRAESFNLFNRPNFGDIQSNLTAGPTFFGRAVDTANTQLGGLNSLYQEGGPRSLQLSLKLIF
jgi:outer membrane receptor protein involved in Fe transport